MPKKSILTISVLAILLVSSIGVIYAMYGDFISSNNDTEPRYTTITPQGVTTTDGIFDKTIKYDTHIYITNQGRVVTYSLDPSQITSITVSQTEHNVILLGEILLRIEQTGGSNDYTFIVSDTSGTMTGTFYTAISTSEDNDTFSAWDNKLYVNGTGVSYSGIDSDIEWIKLRLYVDTSFQSDDSAMATMPLQSVSFTMRVDMEE